MQNESNANKNLISPDDFKRRLNEEKRQQESYEDEGQRKSKRKKSYASLKMVDPSTIAESIFKLEGIKDPTPTGFESLDKALGGGFSSRLYVLGAGSSLGKTTLAAQMADQIAASGKPVLFVTIEQSGREIVVKSLSRIMTGLGASTTADELEDREKRGQWDDEKLSKFDMARTMYYQIAENLHMMQGSGQPTANDIRVAVERISADTGKPPVVFVDYLQLLTSENEWDDDKRTTDRNITALKQIARDLEAPVFVISSLNRSGYNSTVGMGSFKESGGIEYGADVLMGLQPRGIKNVISREALESKKQSKAAEIIDESKKQSVRPVELVILKNRMGTVPREPIPFTFYPAYSTLTEGDGNHRRAAVSI